MLLCIENKKSHWQWVSRKPEGRLSMVPISLCDKGNDIEFVFFFIPNMVFNECEKYPQRSGLD